MGETVCWLQKIHFSYNGILRLKVNSWKKRHHAKENRKTVAIIKFLTFLSTESRVKGTRPSE